MATCGKIRGNKIVVKIVPSFGAEEEDDDEDEEDRGSVPSPSSEDVARWLHVLSVSGTKRKGKKGEHGARGS